MRLGLIVLLLACGESPTENNECDPKEPNSCDDGDSCTLDQCLQDGDATRCDHELDTNREPSDGIFCTVDACLKDGSQEHTPDDTLCDDGQTCDEKRGCVDGDK